jgi:hypothetical protein
MRKQTWNKMCIFNRGRRGRYRMVVGLPTTCTIGYQKKMFIGFTGAFSLSSLPVQIVPVVLEETVNVQRRHRRWMQSDDNSSHGRSYELSRIQTCVLELMHLEITCLLHSENMFPYGGHYYWFLFEILTTLTGRK